MTEKAKMAFREEKINEGPGRERAIWLFFIGIIVSLIGYFFYDFHINQYYISPQTGRKILLSSEYPYQFGGLFLIIVGIVCISIGIIKKIFSRV